MADVEQDELDKLIDAACDDGWDPAVDGWGPSEFDDLETGPPLSADELNSAHTDLARWRMPADFRLAVHRLHKRCRSWEFRGPERKFLLDAWTLAELVRHKSVDQVRLADPSEQWPDGYVQIGRKIENVEVTAAHLPGRRMWDEYKPGEKLVVEHDPVEDWVARAEAIPAALDKAIADKKKKRYGSKTWLVVYLNISEWGIRQAETELIIAQTKQLYADSFDKLFVLWKDKLL
jgi:hypothetical protein